MPDELPIRRRLLVFASLVALAGTASAQQQLPQQNVNLWPEGPARQQGSYDLPPGTDPQNRLVVPFVEHLGQDQKHFWTLPARARKKDLKWIVPAAGGLAALFAADNWISQQVPDRPDQLNRSRKVSDYAFYSLIGAGGGSFLLGKLENNEHMRETGLLAAEAAIGATGATYALKLATTRERPYVINSDGDFLHGTFSSANQSFPSEHSAIAWSIAGVMAHEYPGPFSKFLAYGLASTITLTRVTAKQHFASDVVVGSALGWYFAHEVYRAHHDPELGGEAWPDFDEPVAEEPVERNPKNMSSPYVPPESWVYPSFDRLTALGFIKTAYLGIRPWTRMECARLVEEAGDQLRGQEIQSGEAAAIYGELSNEFRDELVRLEGEPNIGASIDSVYVRGTQISGTPLTDSYHFAQTLINDYGRPYSSGFNSTAGFSAHAVAGPFSVGIQGEYQSSPAVPGYSPVIQQAIASADATLPVPGGRGSISRFDVLQGTVALQFNNFQISAGKQSYWWSTSQTDPLLLGDNAEPILSVKLDNVSPYHIPLLSKIFGDARSEYFMGRLDGHQFEFDVDHLIGPAKIEPQPFIQGLKLSFRPTQNFEFGFGFTAMFGGPGLPVTFHNFLRTFYSHTSQFGTNPGKRTSELDFSYRVPGLRNWLTIYRDSLAVDEYTPLTSSRPSMNIGLYMPKLPKLGNMDFRAEIIGTPHTHEFPPGYVYWDFRRYRDGYTNDGNLLASWMGRAGRGGQGWLTYWFSPRSVLQAGYRYEKVDRD
ncbi:MAG TPA: capsule assembly Wzi family protein, partial [Candidatus Binataceae bacterium]|nr:capsule assembly Wzi family protein [Candidatus Binataceae bacterium]